MICWKHNTDTAFLRPCLPLDLVAFNTRSTICSFLLSRSYVSPTFLAHLLHSRYIRIVFVTRLQRADTNNAVALHDWHSSQNKVSRNSIKISHESYVSLPIVITGSAIRTYSNRMERSQFSDLEIRCRSCYENRTRFPVCQRRPG